MKFDINSQFEDIMKENIPFPTPSREVDFLGINNYYAGSIWKNHKRKINGEEEETCSWIENS